MGFIDMSMEELKSYVGQSRKPDDFEAFWEEHVNQLSVGEVEWIEAEFKVPFAQCFHLYFQSTDDVRVHAKVIIPHKKGKKPAVIKFHGYAGYSGEWSEILHFAASGYVAVSMDCRGQGGLSEDSNSSKGSTMYGQIVRGVEAGRSHLYYTHVFSDTVQLTKIVMQMTEVEETDVSVVGISQGGALALVCASLVPEIKKVSVAYPYLSDYRRVWELKLDTFAYEALSTYFRRFDPRHEREEMVFNTLEYIDVQNFVGGIKGDVQFFTGLSDDVCPPSSQFAVYNKIKSEKDLLVYPDFGHEKLTDMLDLQLQFILEGSHEIKSI